MTSLGKKTTIWKFRCWARRESKWSNSDVLKTSLPSPQSPTQHIARGVNRLQKSYDIRQCDSTVTSYMLQQAKSFWYKYCCWTQCWRVCGVGVRGGGNNPEQKSHNSFRAGTEWKRQLKQAQTHLSYFVQVTELKNNHAIQSILFGRLFCSVTKSCSTCAQPHWGGERV